MTSHTENQASKPGPEHKTYSIHIDKQLYKVTETPETGEQIRHVPQTPIGADYDLWLEVPGGEDVLVGDGDEIEIREGQHFFTSPKQINPGGC